MKASSFSYEIKENTIKNYISGNLKNLIKELWQM